LLRASRRNAANGKVTMKIATFNVNGVNGRLRSLLEWLDSAKPDVACLQELKRCNRAT
jgi:exonuclease III